MPRFYGAPTGRRPSKEYVLQFKDGTFFVADDEEPKTVRSLAARYLGRERAIREAKTVAEMWGEPVAVVPADEEPLRVDLEAVGQ